MQNVQDVEEINAYLGELVGVAGRASADVDWPMPRVDRSPLRDICLTAVVVFHEVDEDPVEKAVPKRKRRRCLRIGYGAISYGREAQNILQREMFWVDVELKFVPESGSQTYMRTHSHTHTHACTPHGHRSTNSTKR